MKNKQNQEVKPNDVVALFTLILTGVLIFAPVWKGRQDELQVRTLRRAESLAFQIIEARQGAQRGPASVSEGALNQLNMDQGQVGEDPWGRPYNFQLFGSNNEDAKQLVIWSAGPNGISDTQANEFASKRDNQSLQFPGDDLGIIVSVK